MKRKCLKMLVCGLTTVMLASGLTGCSGCKESGETGTSEIVSEEISEEISEEVSEGVSVEASEESTEEVKEEVSEEVSESPSEEKETASQEPSSETKEETSVETTSEEVKEEVSEEPAEKPGEEKPSEIEKPSEEAKPAYTVEAMSATMYAQRAVNVRKGPGTEYEKIGGLSLNQEVSVTGKASTGWYEISYNGTVGYVAGSYLGTEKVAEQPAPAPSTPATPPAENTTPPAENTPVTPPASTPVEPAPSTPSTPSAPSAPVQETYTAYIDTSFLGLVNSHRTANGVREVTWNSGMEQVALARIEAMARSGQLNHDGNPGSAEVLAINFSGSSSEFMSQYLASPGHYSSLLKDMNAEYGTNSMVSATCKHTYGDTGAFTEYYNVIIIFNDYNDEWADVFN